MLILGNIHLLFLIFVLTSLAMFGAKSKGVDNIAGISIGLYARYVFVTEIVMTHWKDSNMIEEIKSWSIIMLLNKPISFVWFYFSQTYFKNLINILIVWSFCGVILFAFIWKFPWFGILHFGLFLISFLVGIGLLSLISLMIAMFAFMLEDSTFIRLLINKLYFIFGGLFFPLDIYPHWLRIIAEAFPFKYFLYAPAKFFTTGDIAFFLGYFPMQIVRLLIMFVVIYLIYSRAVRRLEINGG
jgi:ABC-2 type transport system permease protein